MAQKLQKDRFFRRQGGTKPGPDDTIGDFACLKQRLTADDLQHFLIRAYQYVIARYKVDGFCILQSANLWALDPFKGVIMLPSARVRLRSFLN